MQQPHHQMLMVVFGAGASYDSSPDQRLPTHHLQDAVENERPPLANELFEDRDMFAATLERFPQARPIVPRLRNLQPGESVESVMETLQAEADRDPRRNQQLAAVRYYLQSILYDCVSAWHRTATRGVTNYKTLLDAIEHTRTPDERVCLVTFNYDTMLEDALPESVGMEIRSIGDYVASKSYKVIKLHGSVNWGREAEPPVDHVGAVGDQQLVLELINRAATLKVTERYHVVDQRPIVRLDAQRPLVPAIALPLLRKGAFECPAEHLATLHECLREVRQLLAIGWRATDAPFLELMHERGLQAIRGLVVAGGPEPAREVIDNLRRGLDRPGAFHSSAGGFTDFIVQHEVEAFLRTFRPSP